jgi:hypothetical protein
MVVQVLFGSPLLEKNEEGVRLRLHVNKNHYYLQAPRRVVFMPQTSPFEIHVSICFDISKCQA